MKDKKDFDRVAATWDDNPRRVLLAKAVAEAISQQVPLTRQMSAVDFGCGTALVSFCLVDRLAQILAVDSAAAMLEVVEKKAQYVGQKNISTQFCPQGLPDFDGQLFDLIYSSMVLHHIDELAPLLDRLVASLSPGGYLALADLDVEDGSFHDQPGGVEHHGIDRHWLGQQLKQRGLFGVEAITAHTIQKERDGIRYDFPVFLICGRKPE